LAWPNPHEAILAPNILRDEMAFGRRRHEVAIDARLHVKETIDRAPGKFDLERVQLPAVADAGDIG